LAQAAALLGREFDVHLLQAVTSLDQYTLGHWLARLLAEEIIETKEEEGQGFLFRHALLQDAAYESLLKSNRAALHKRIAEVVEQQFPEKAEIEPEWLGQHFTLAGLPGKAIPYWDKAGQRALMLTAYQEASRLFETALEQTALLPEDPSRHGLELGLQLQLGLVFAGARGYASPGVEAAYQRARELCSWLGDTADLFPVLRGLASFYIVRGDLPTAMELSLQCMRLANETAKPDYAIEAYYTLGYTQACEGKLRLGADNLALSVHLYDDHDGDAMSFPCPQNPRMGCLSELAILRWMIGEAGLSLFCIEKLETYTLSSERAFDQAYALCYGGVIKILQGRFEAAVQEATKTLEIPQRFGYELWLEAGKTNLALAQAYLTGKAVWINAYKNSVEVRHAAGWDVWMQFFHTQLACLYQRVGDPWSGMGAVEEAFKYSRAYGEDWYLPEQHRLRGELLVSLGEREKGEADLHEAMRIAEIQGAHWFQLRTAMASLRLADTPDKQANAKSLLERAVFRIDKADGLLIPEWLEAKGNRVVGLMD